MANLLRRLRASAKGHALDNWESSLSLDTIFVFRNSAIEARNLSADKLAVNTGCWGFGWPYFRDYAGLSEFEQAAIEKALKDAGKNP